MFSSPANEKLLTEDALSAAHRADIRWLGVSPWAHGAFQSSRNGLTCSDHRSGLRTRLPAGRSRSCERTSSGSAPRARIYCLQAARGPYQPRSSGEAACNVARAMGHSRSTLVDAVYAHSLASGMAGVAERDAGRVFDAKPQLRVLESGASPDVRQPLEENTIAAAKAG